MYTRLSAPISVQWELTPWCTYNCVHCYNYWRRKKPPRRFLTAKQLEDHSITAQEIINARVFHVTLTGGEPLGVIKQVFPTLLALRNAGITLDINTNLALLDKSIILLLQQLEIRSILTSLISANPQLNDEMAQHKGAYQLTVSSIKLAVESGFRVSVNMVVSQKNFHTIHDSGRLSSALGAVCFCATKVSKPTNCPDFSGYPLSTFQLREMFLQLLRIKEEFGIRVDSLEHYPACIFPNDAARTAFGKRNCSAAKTNCTVSFDGFVRPCSHAPMSYGNVALGGLLDAWKSMAAWREGSLVPPVCKQQCGEFPRSCGGGCRIEALNVCNGLNGTDPYSLNQKPEAKILPLKTALLYPDARVALEPDVLFRPEEFGYIAYASSSKWLAIDAALHDILVASLRGGISISSPSLASAYRCSEEAAFGTLNLLKRKKIIRAL